MAVPLQPDARVSFDLEDMDAPDATRMLSAYEAELMRLFGTRTANSAANHPEEFRPPHGVFLVVRRAGDAVGCGGVRRLEPGVGELKRMYLEPSVRGAGLGAQLLRALEQRAVEAGYHTLRLDSRRVLEAALGMYRTAGYREIPPYNDNPDAQVWMERRLAGGAG